MRQQLLHQGHRLAQAGFVLAALVLSTRAFAIDLGRIDDLAMVLVAALTIASAAAYLAGWLRHMAV